MLEAVPLNNQARDLTVAEVAKLTGHGRNFVMDLIKTGRLRARDERGPRSSLPRYRVSPEAIEAWKLSCEVVQPSEVEKQVRRHGRLAGLTRKRIAARHARSQRARDQHQSA